MAIRLTTALALTANTATNGSGTIVDLVVGSAHGSRIDHIVICALGSTTTGMIRFFTNPTGSGAWRLLKEVVVPITTATPTTQKWTAVVNMPAMYVGHNQKIGVATNNAESFTVTAMCEDL